MNTRQKQLNCIETFSLRVTDDDDDAASRGPQPMSSSALIKLAEGDEDVVEDLELSDDDWGPTFHQRSPENLRLLGFISIQLFAF